MTDDPKRISKIEQRLDALVQAEIQKRHTHRILLAVQSMDKTLDYRGGGDASVGPQPSSLTNGVGSNDSLGTPQPSHGDPFFIASITKMYTATVVFQLVDEGLVDLKATIDTYLPKEMIQGIHIYKDCDYSFQIQVHHLLHHSSGLPDYFGQPTMTSTTSTTEENRMGWRTPSATSVEDKLKRGQDVSLSLEDILEMTRHQTPHFPPGGPRRHQHTSTTDADTSPSSSSSASYYSDTNYQLLGAIVERVTNGTSLAEHMQKRIFQPLGLSSQTYSFDAETSSPSSSQSEKNRKEPMWFYNMDQEVRIPRAMASFVPDGGLVTTTDDLLVFLRAYFDGQLFDPKHHTRLEDDLAWNTVFYPVQYGLGVMKFALPKIFSLWGWLGPHPPPLVGHSGSNGAFAFFVPSQRVYITGTMNQLDQESRSFQFMLQVLNCVMKE